MKKMMYAAMLIVILALVLAACGSDGDVSSASPSPIMTTMPSHSPSDNLSPTVMPELVPTEDASSAAPTGSATAPSPAAGLSPSAGTASPSASAAA